MNYFDNIIHKSEEFVIRDRLKMMTGSLMTYRGYNANVEYDLDNDICLDSGAKKILLPQTSAVDLGTVPAELMSSFSLVFYQSAEDAVFKALGVE